MIKHNIYGSNEQYLPCTPPQQTASHVTVGAMKHRAAPNAATTAPPKVTVRIP